MKKEYSIPIFVPHLDCKKCCTFCNKRFSKEDKKQVTEEDVKYEIEKKLRECKKKSKEIQVFFEGGNFTSIEKEKQEELLKAVQPYIKAKEIKSICVSSRPEDINKSTLKMLKKYHVNNIELVVISSNNYILEKCKGGHTFEDVIRATKLIKLYRFKLGLQIMVGLPESNEKDDLQTAKDCIKLKPKKVRISQVLVTNGTQLEEEYKKGDYIPLTISQAVERNKEIVKLLEQKHIRKIEIENKYKNNIIAGPYHSDFEQLVNDSIWYDRIVEKIKNINAKVIRVEIEANPQDTKNIIGYKEENITKLKDTYAVITIVKNNEQIKLGKFKLNVLEVA